MTNTLDLPGPSQLRTAAWLIAGVLAGITIYVTEVHRYNIHVDYRASLGLTTGVAIVSMSLALIARKFSSNLPNRGWLLFLALNLIAIGTTIVAPKGWGLALALTWPLAITVADGFGWRRRVGTITSLM